MVPNTDLFKQVLKGHQSKKLEHTAAENQINENLEPELQIKSFLLNIIFTVWVFTCLQ